MTYLLPPTPPCSRFRKHCRTWGQKECKRMGNGVCALWNAVFWAWHSHHTQKLRATMFTCARSIYKTLYKWEKSLWDPAISRWEIGNNDWGGGRISHFLQWCSFWQITHASLKEGEDRGGEEDDKEKRRRGSESGRGRGKIWGRGRRGERRGEGETFMQATLIKSSESYTDKKRKEEGHAGEWSNRNRRVQRGHG